MIKKSTIIHKAILGALILTSASAGAKEVARFSMENNNGKTTEIISGSTFDIKGVHGSENVAGACGKALRFDGYSTYIDASVGNIIPASSKDMTVSLWCAIETYPIVEVDVNTKEQVAIASCLNETAKTGFGFFVGFDGKYSFKTYVGGWPLELKVDTPLPRNQWINLSVVIDSSTKKATLYNNGVVVASSKANGGIAVSNSVMRIGRSLSERNMDKFCLTSFNGLIDDITVWDEPLEESTIKNWKAENDADLSIPQERFAEDPLRPMFHGMPGANWTNETHGMTYADGRYHVFFQKNANGPYMARLHWGHISSENLMKWHEEPIAIAPGDVYDMKGCWSGCVFTDEQITNGKPSIIYTGVDYAKAVIAQATPNDEQLVSWTKNGVIINGKPSGLSDDFRDPYFFRTEDGAYIMVGSSKDGVGTTTLHSYNPNTRMWSNDGKMFFTGTDIASCGTFWEMPNVTKMGNKWLFTVTPQQTSRGVAAIYWTGTIKADGTFSPDKSTPMDIELSGFARNGYGMLSPTILQHNDKTIALGIVPDKLPASVNYDLGYAHTYSLPREWTLDDNGNLCQKPYSEVTDMREGLGFIKSNFTLNGVQTMEGVTGRSVELLGEYVVGTGKAGFTLLDDGANSLKVYYDGATNEIVVDARGLERFINDTGTFNGYYHSALPRQLTKGETIKLNVFFDHSILDIFVNDTWATSVRIFANTKSTENITSFTDAVTTVNILKGWILNVNKGGVNSIESVLANHTKPNISAINGSISYSNLPLGSILEIYTLSGNKVQKSVINSTHGSISTNFKGLHIVAIRSAQSSIAEKIVL